MSSHRLHQRVRTVDLDHDQLMVFSDPAGICVQVLFGGVWLTEERCAQDRIARAGEWLWLQGTGRAVAEAIEPARLRVIEPARRFGAALCPVWQRWRPRFARLAPRSLAAMLALVLSLGMPEMLGRAAYHPAPVDQTLNAVD